MGRDAPEVFSALEPAAKSIRSTGVSLVHPDVEHVWHTATMHDDLIFEALVYHRNVGASLSELHEHLEWRQSAPQTKEDYLSALGRLEAAGRIFEVDEKWFLTPDGYKQAKGKALEPEWQWEDSWILLALLISSNERKLCKLEDIIHAADYINRALPSLGELHGALNRLSAGRLLR